MCNPALAECVVECVRGQPAARQCQCEEDIFGGKLCFVYGDVMISAAPGACDILHVCRKAASIVDLSADYIIISLTGKETAEK
eukprot:2526079-Pleurochrysis_carterae.AAC.5